MGIQSAMFSGVSGLNTNSQAMSVIGNNLANTNTLGFKGARSVFSDLLSSNVFGSGGTSQVGRGVGLSTIDNIFSQGTFETTSSDTDVAIEGEGFFVVSELGDETSYYTRAGSFRFNEEGYLTNPEGFVVQGKAFTDGVLTAGDPDDIQVTNIGLIEANPTDELTFTTNLDAKSVAMAAGANLILPDDQTSYHYTASSQVYDSLGEAHLVSVYFRNIDEVNNEWAMAYTVDGGVAGVPATDIAPNLIFDDKGLIDTDGDNNTDAGGNYLGADAPLAIPITIATWGNGSEDGQVIDLTFDCTQFDSASVVIGQNQNGYGAGELTNVSIDGEGTVIAAYSNGEQIKISQLVLAKFQNPGGLSMAGSNHFAATEQAGTIRVGLPGPELGSIFTNSLEQSNVDMGQEFVKMISTQRGFQANSKIISTVDEMLGELINLKR